MIMSEPSEVKIALDGVATLHDLFAKSMEAWPGTFFKNETEELYNLELEPAEWFKVKK